MKSVFHFFCSRENFSKWKKSKKNYKKLLNNISLMNIECGMYEIKRACPTALTGEKSNGTKRYNKADERASYRSAP